MAERYSDYINSSNLRRKSATTVGRRLETDAYNAARLVLSRALQTSDLKTEDEVDQRPASKMRKITIKRPLSDSDSDMEQAESSLSKKKTGATLPAAPHVYPPPSLPPSTPNRSHQPAFSPPMMARRQSVSQSRSAQSLTSCSPSCEPILREFLTQLEILKEQQKEMLVQLQSRTSAAEQTDVSGFPLATLEDLRQMETLISAEKDFKEKLVTYFGLVGAFSVKETVWRVLSKMISNSLAKTINWRGMNGKTGFQSFALKDVVLKSVRRNSETANASDGETERFIKRWLQLASDREGGRRERALRQVVPEQQR